MHCNTARKVDRSHTIATFVWKLWWQNPRTGHCSSYKNWPSRWVSHSTRIDDTIYMPPTAATITTPLMTQNWLALLAGHPDKQLTEFFTTGISHGFRIGYNAPQSTLRSASQNLACALQYPEVVDQYLSEELAHHRVAGPFHRSWGSHVHVSRFGVIPKKNQSNKWQLIINISHPTGQSINDRIPKELCSPSYISVFCHKIYTSNGPWYTANKSWH